MIIDKLDLNQVRVFDSGASFDFDERMNLIIGVNGSGKSTTLYALRTLLTQVFSTVVHEYPHRAEDFGVRDITIGGDFLTAEAAFKICGAPVSYTRSLPREESVPDEEREGKVRHQTIQTKDAKEWTSMEPSGPSSSSEIKEQIRDGDETPLAIYFSPERSVVVRREPQHGSEKGGTAAAYASALSSQKFNVKRFAAWMRVQERLMENESDQHGRRIEAVTQVIDRFLGRYENLRSVQDEDSPSLRIDLDERTLDVEQLSDGERGILSLVLDITTRLAQANPQSSSPLDEKAVVLIDELELHLHPGWQREIVERLTRTFPNCQFICTTHSPQVISEVENGSVFALERENDGITVHEEEAYGLDTNWVLEHIMDVSSHPDEIQRLISKAEKALANQRYGDARDFISSIENMVRRESGEITRLKSKIETLEMLSEDAGDTQERKRTE